MGTRVVVLGAGFGGLELTTILSETFGDKLDLTLIDKNDSFFFGFSKFDVIFGHKTSDAVRLHYRHIVKPGVRFRQEAITKIDPAAKRVTTDRGTYDADILVVALGADYDFEATPGLLAAGNEFYSMPGAECLRTVLPNFTKGHILVGVCGAPFKCPPAPSEMALLLHDHLATRGIRGACEISLSIPFGVPIPPSPATSQALIAAFAERGIKFLPKKLVKSLDPARHVAVFDDNSELSYDLFLGVPKHRVPGVVEASGLCDKGWIHPNPKNLTTQFPGVYAIGDCASVGTAKAGVFAEGAARVAAASIIAEIRGEKPPAPYTGEGTCYIEFGGERVGRVDVNFLSGPSPVGSFVEPSIATADEKKQFGASRRARWFGLGNLDEA